mgnify:FL=1
MSLAVKAKRGRREPPEWKKKIVEELTDVLGKYRYAIFADLEGLPANHLQQLRRQFRDVAYFRVVKKNLLYLALEKRGVKRESLEGYLKHGVLVIATNENPFLLAYKLEQYKTPAPAKPGQTAPKDIVVPEGDTGLRPGPIVSVFGKLKIPYEIRKGTIYIKSDTVVAKKGDVISAELAGLLQQLGIQPMEIGVRLVAALDGTLVIPGDMLHLDLEATRKDLLDSEEEALKLALNAAFLLVPEALAYNVALSVQEGITLARSVALPLDADTAKEGVLAAAAEAEAVVSRLGDAAKQLGLEVQQVAQPQPAAQAPPSAEKKPEEKEKKEGEQAGGASEENISEGLSSLFGGL